MEVTLDSSQQATSQSLTEGLSKFPQEVTKTRNFASVPNLAIPPAAATQSYIRTWQRAVNHSSRPHKDIVESQGTWHSAATARLGNLAARHISALKHGSGTHQPSSFTPSGGCPLRAETSHQSNGSCTSFHCINWAVAKTRSTPGRGSL